MPEEALAQEQPAPELDAAQLAHLNQRLEFEQNLPLGIAAGLVAALAGAAAWAVITVVTGYQIGLVAIGVGFLVGYAVRWAGKGVTQVFGIAGAVLALLGCGLGNLLAVTALVAQEQGIGLLSALSQLTPELVQVLMVASFTPMDLLFYGLAVYEGYRFAFRQVTADELQRMLPGSAPRITA